MWSLFESHSVSWVVVTGVGYGITWIQNLFSAYGFGVCLIVSLGFVFFSSHTLFPRSLLRGWDTELPGSKTCSRCMVSECV
jgi:hypothetical protein